MDIVKKGGLVKRHFRNFIITAAALFLGGCSLTPVPVSHTTSDQKRMQAAHHWAVLAEDVADQLQAGLQSGPMWERPIYVAPGKETAFDQGFHEFLVTQMVNRGMRVVPVPLEGALEVACDTQVVYHREKRRSRPYPGAMTAGTALIGTGVWVLRDAFVYGSSLAQKTTVGAVALGTAAVADLVIGAAGPSVPHSEVIITTSVFDGDTYFMRKTDVYYVNDEDQWHYQPVMTGRTIPVTGEIEPPAAEQGTPKP